MAKCIFCGKEQDDFKGAFLMKNDGTVNYYCSGKCQKNHLKLKRDKRKVRWTEAFHLVRAKRLSKEKERVEKVKAKKSEKIAKSNKDSKKE